MRHHSRAKIIGQIDGLAKVITDLDGKILGVHLVGPHTTEIIGSAELAMRVQANVKDLATLMFPHPTISETLAEAAADAMGICKHLPPKKKISE